MYYATQDGNRVDDDDVDNVLEQVDKFIDQMEDFAENLDENRDIPFLAKLDEKFTQYLKTLTNKSKLSKDKIEIVKAVYETRLLEEKADTACQNLNELSLIGWNEYIDSDGDYMVNLKRGYSELIKHFCSKIPTDCIKINEAVTKIHWPSSDAQKLDPASCVVSVTTRNQITKEESVFIGKCCLCTMSLGFLKKSYTKLFNPPLPNNKVNAIERLGFGTVNKLFLIFDQALFNKDVQGLQILWRKDLNFELQSAKRWRITVG